MGYHVAILRTGLQNKSVHQEEIVSVVGGQFGFDLERDDSGSIKQVSRDYSGEEVLLFYDEPELWAKNPTDTVLRVMIEIAMALGNGARVRGDEGETYESVTKTYIHADDIHIHEEEKSQFDWPYWLPRALKVLIGLILVFSFGKILLKWLS